MSFLPNDLESAVSCINLNLKSRRIDDYFAQTADLKNTVSITYGQEGPVAFYVPLNKDFAEYCVKTKTFFPSKKNRQAKDISLMLEHMGYRVKEVQEFTLPLSDEWIRRPSINKDM